MRGVAAPRARALPPWYVGRRVYYDLLWFGMIGSRWFTMIG